MSVSLLNRLWLGKKKTSHPPLNAVRLLFTMGGSMGPLGWPFSGLPSPDSPEEPSNERLGDTPCWSWNKKETIPLNTFKSHFEDNCQGRLQKFHLIFHFFFLWNSFLMILSFISFYFYLPYLSVRYVDCNWVNTRGVSEGFVVVYWNTIRFQGDRKK